MAPLLFIVARDKPNLYDSLADEVARQHGMQVILDRRHGERRQRTQPHELERRRADRRDQPIPEGDLRSHGFVAIPRE